MKIIYNDKDFKRLTTKEKLKYATLDIISQKGVNAIHIRDIANKVNISEAAVYRHFKSKKQLIEEVVKDLILSNFERILDKAIKKYVNPEKQLRYLIDEIFLLLKQNPYIVKLFLYDRIYYDNRSLFEIVKEYFNKNLQRLKNIIEEGIKKGCFSKYIDPLTASLIIRGSLISLFVYLEINSINISQFKGKEIFIDHIFILLKGGMK